jgi:hypothetical protein
LQELCYPNRLAVQAAPVKESESALSKRLGTFIICVLLHLGLPLAPLFIELVITGDVSEKSVSVGATMYAASIGVSSRWKLTLAAVVLAIICFSPMYGIALTHHDAVPSPAEKAYTLNQQDAHLEYLVHVGMKKYSLILIAGVFILHLTERFNRHVLRKEPFWNFD